MSAISSQPIIFHESKCTKVRIKVTTQTDEIHLRIISTNLYTIFHQSVITPEKGVYQVSIPQEHIDQNKKIQLIGFKFEDGSLSETGSSYQATTLILRGNDPLITF